MPTYADEWNERQAALGSVPSSHPVRLTISRGDYVLDPSTGLYRWAEEWTSEDLMECESLSSAPASLTSSPSPSQLRLRAGDGGRTLWVLDTNTLLTQPSLDLLKALFSLLLTSPPAIALVIPYTVLTELDALKSNDRLGHLAREANRWILAALRAQKKSRPESEWALHAQPNSHRQAMTNDESIIAFCKSLGDHGVLFCSDDVSARLRAEAEGVQTLELAEVVRNLRREQAGRDIGELASIVLEQWLYQAGDGEAGSMDVEQPEMQVEEIQVTAPAYLAAPPSMQASTTQLAAPTIPPHLAPSTPPAPATSTFRQSTSPPGRSLSDSIHARHRPKPAPAPSARRPQPTGGEETNPYIEWPGASQPRW